MVAAYTASIQTTREKEKGLITTHQGGSAYGVDKWTQARRFLVLGSEGSTYYESEKTRTDYNIKSVKECLAEDGLRMIDMIREVSDKGLAFKNEPAILALALAASFTDKDRPQYQEAIRQYALSESVYPKVCRTSTHHFHFADYVDHLRGWGSGLRKGLARWYTEKSDMALANQVTKYVQRDGWSHADILRLTHPTPKTDTQNAIFKYVVDGIYPKWHDTPEDGVKLTIGNKALDYINAVEAVKNETDILTIVQLIQRWNLPREVLPTLALNDPNVWAALLYAGDGMPMTAMIRNLGNMSKVGLLVPLSDASRFVVDRLNSTDNLQQARVHPIDLIKAKFTYENGKGLRGSGQWEVDRNIAQALEDAFYLSFGTIQPTGKSGILALDISGSMTWEDIGGIPGFNPRVASAVMAMVTARVESSYEILAFSSGTHAAYRSYSQNRDGVYPIDIRPADSLNTVYKKIDNLWAGGTDCSLPMKYATKHNRKADYFIVYTDNETGYSNPSDALRQYRSKSQKHDSKLIVVGMIANQISIADPTDRNMLDVVGFDSSAPQVISAFVRGEI